MSGLASFFHQAEPQQEDGGSAECGYAKSTADLWQEQSQNEPQQENDPNPSLRSSVILPSLRSIFPTTRHPISFEGEGQWKEFHQDWINGFMNHRLLVQHNNSQTNTPTASPTNASVTAASVSPPPPMPPPRKRFKKSFSTSLPDHDHLLQDKQLETLRRREEETNDDNDDTAARNVSSNSTATEIELRVPPHVSETLHTATQLGHVDLHAKAFRLGPLQVSNWTPLRRTRRPARTMSQHKQTIYTSHGEWRSMSLRPCTDDGPLSVIYASVMRLELVQNVSSTTRLQQLTDAATQTTPIRRLSLFVYRLYAKALASLLATKTPKTALWQLQLEHVPPECVLPDTDTALVDWYNRHDHCKYCLCIGDDSFMQVSDIPQRFDGFQTNAEDGSLAIRVSWVEGDTTQREWEIAACHEGYIKEIRPEQEAKDGEPPSKTRITASSNAGAPAPDTPMAGAATTTLAGEDRRDASKNSRQPASAATTKRSRRSRNRKRPSPHATADTTTVRTSLGRTETTTPTSDYEAHYHKLGELEAYHQTNAAIGTSTPLADVYGVVLGIGTLTRTKRGEWMISLVLIDDSCKNNINNEDNTEANKDNNQTSGGASHMTVVANLFCKQREGLPKVLCCGDVVRLHRCKVQLWNGNVQLMGARATSYLVYRKQLDEDNVNDDLVVTDSPSKKCSVSQHDESRFPELWEWGQEHIQSHPTILRPEKIWNLGDIQYNVVGSSSENEEEEGDLTVMVSALLKLPQRTEQDPVGYVRVWDGTGNAPSDPLPPGISQQQAQELRRGGDPPSSALVCLNEIVTLLNQEDDRHPTLLTIDAVIGWVTNVAVWEPEQWELLEHADPGTFLRLRNVKAKPLPGSNDNVRCLMMDKKCHLTPLPDLAYEVVQLMQNHNKRLAQNDEFNPNSGVRPLEVAEGDDDSTPSGTEALSDLSEFEKLRETGCFEGTICILDTGPSVLRSQTDEEKLLRFFETEKAVGLKVFQDDDDDGDNVKKKTSRNECELGVMVLDSSPAAHAVRELFLHTSKDETSGFVSSPLRRAIVQKKKWKATIYSTIWEEDNSLYYTLDTLEEV